MRSNIREAEKLASTDMLVYRQARYETPMSEMLAAYVRGVMRVRAISATELTRQVIGIYKFFYDEYACKRQVFIDEFDGVPYNYAFHELYQPKEEILTGEFFWLNVNINENTKREVDEITRQEKISHVELFRRAVWLYVRVRYDQDLKPKAVWTQNPDGSNRREVWMM